MKIYKFRNCYLHTAERRVLQNGKYLELSSKTLDVLQLLIEKRGEVVTKDEILGEVWNGSFVEEGNLAVHISRLRRSFAESKNEPFIETVQGSGYRFITSVKEVGEDEWEKNLVAETQPYNEKTFGESVIDSIAVLPLENESGDLEIDYLADGLTESFINSLSRIPDLKVIARNTVFRYKNKDIDSIKVGETLAVAAVLTGRIRILKENLMISIELIKVADGTQIWGTKLNQPFSDIIEVQEKIIFAVSEKLRSEISNVARKSLTNTITNTPESYRLYLKGKYLLEKRVVEDVWKAIECFENSVCFDPINVHSYSAIVECYIWLLGVDQISRNEALSKINPVLSVISELNKSVDLVQAMYGGVKMYLDWNFEESKRHLEYALKLNPNCLFALYRYSYILTTIGRFSEALKILQQLLEFDPLSLVTYKRIARVFYKMGRPANALVYIKDALELENTDWEALMILGAALAELGNFEEALNIFNQCLSISYEFEALAMIGYVNALGNKKDEASKIIQQIESQSINSQKHSIKLARIYVALGENDMVFELLEQALDQHEFDLTSLRSDPRWKKISKDKRFETIVSKIGFPAN